MKNLETCTNGMFNTISELYDQIDRQEQQSKF